MDTKGYIYKRKANYYETDCMGIIHHSNYIRYFEEARIEYMYSIGCDIREMEKLGIIIPNVDAYARYYKTIKFFDDVEIEVRLTEFTGARMKLEYTIRFAETGKLASAGFTTHCFVNEKFKPMSLRRAYPELFNKLKEHIVSSDSLGKAE